MSQLPNTAALKQLQRAELIAYIKQGYQQHVQTLNARFWAGEVISSSLQSRAAYVDSILKSVWVWLEMDRYPDTALFAVGGFGSGHLHPYSDIDTLILYTDVDNVHQQERIENFVALLWDCGIELSASVRTVSENNALAAAEHSVFTNLLSARFICGSEKHRDYLFGLISPEQHSIWPFQRFFKAKRQERKERYQRFQNSEYNQEPNLKESPGGLRDIDFILWLSQRKYGAIGMQGLLEDNGLTHYELQILKTSRETFWHMRYALHVIARKSCDRLYLEYQTEIVKSLNMTSDSINQAVSLWMQKYFRLAAQVRVITDMLTQHFKEEEQQRKHRSTPAHDTDQTVSPICNAINHYLELNTSPEHLNPYVFMHIFLAYAKRSDIKGFSAKTRRVVYDYFNSQCPDDFLEVPQVKSLFLQIFEHPSRAAKTLTLMHQLGALSKVIPSFAALFGQMQYDLNHIYTVDAHTLRVLQNIEDFYQTPPMQLPHLSLSLSIANEPLLLYLAGFFHDSGKGKGGNHSEIGALIVDDFCRSFQLSEHASTLIRWLVLNHLALSHFAQRKDINDQHVIIEFGKIVETKEKLCYLYLLTVADIKGTNPKLWNEWRQSLLSELFHRTLDYFDQQNLPLQHTNIKSKQDVVLHQLASDDHDKQNLIKELWQHIPFSYFEQTDIDNIAWQTTCIIQTPAHQPCIAVRPHWNKVGTDLFVYAVDAQGLFACICQTLEKLQLTIVEAKIAATNQQYCLYAMVILESSGHPIASPQRLLEIQTALTMLVKPLYESKLESITLPYYSRHVPRWYRYYQTHAKVLIYTPINSLYSTIEIHAPDFPGLLARVGKILVSHGISIHSAKINTLGDKVIDYFYVTYKQSAGPLLDDNLNEQIKTAILDALLL